MNQDKAQRKWEELQKNDQIKQDQYRYKNERCRRCNHARWRHKLLSRHGNKLDGYAVCRKFLEKLPSITGATIPVVTDSATVFNKYKPDNYCMHSDNTGNGICDLCDEDLFEMGR